jgi:hypothetical protein
MIQHINLRVLFSVDFDGKELEVTILVVFEKNESV